jgi:hypothetical protein
VDNRLDRLGAHRGVALFLQECLVRRAVRCLMSAIRRQSCQSVLRGKPSRLLPDVGRQDEERFPTQARKSLVLVKDGWQLCELDAVGVQFAW